MIDEKRIEKYRSAADSMPEEHATELREIARLARLGLWAEKHAIRALTADLNETIIWIKGAEKEILKKMHYRAEEALASLPKDEK